LGSPSSIAASGLQVAALSLDVSASNVANSQTDGYEPSEVAPADLDGGGATAAVLKNTDPLAEVRADRALLAPSGTDLIQEMVAQSRAVAVYQANLVSLKTGDEMNQTLLDAVGTR
jgi:flagellar basal body rod protein FlgC